MYLQIDNSGSGSLIPIPIPTLKHSSANGDIIPVHRNKDIRIGHIFMEFDVLLLLSVDLVIQKFI
jgi:hypothetical protein